jgi:phosphomannomutase
MDPDAKRVQIVDETGKVLSREDMILLGIKQTFDAFPEGKSVVLDNATAADPRIQRFVKDQGGKIIPSGAKYSQIYKHMKEKKVHFGAGKTGLMLWDYSAPFEGINDGIANGLLLAILFARGSGGAEGILSELNRLKVTDGSL